MTEPTENDRAEWETLAGDAGVATIFEIDFYKARAGAREEGRRQAIEECAKLVETEKMSPAHGDWLWKTYLPRLIRSRK